jgi:hypothetical protein
VSLLKLSLTPTAARALLAGGAFLLVWALASQAPSLFRRILAGRTNPRWQRLARAPAWPFVGRLLGLAYALGALVLALESAHIAALDVGLQTPAWEELAAWLPAVAGLTALWAAVLWGAYWRLLPPQEDHSPQAAYGTTLGLVAHLMGEEAWATLLRGALIPALGGYWGPWAAVLVRGAASLASPSVRRRLGDRAARPFLYLDWAMDWIAAGCFVASGSLWASLIARAAGHLAANLVHQALYQWARRRARRQTAQAD